MLRDEARPPLPSQPHESQRLHRALLSSEDPHIGKSRAFFAGKNIVVCEKAEKLANTIVLIA